MKASTCAANSAAVRKKERQEKAIEGGNFGGALGFKVTVVATKTVEVEIIFKPHCCIKRPKKKESEKK